MNEANQSHYPRKFVPKPGTVTTIHYWTQYVPDGRLTVHFRDGISGESGVTIADLLADGHTEVFDHLPAEQAATDVDVLDLPIETILKNTPMRYGAREPDGTRTMIVEGASDHERTVAELRAEVERLKDPDKCSVPHDVQERIKELRTELAERKATARRAAQMLIEEVGAPGPENVDETAVRAVNKIKAMRERIDELTARAEAAEAKLAETMDTLTKERAEFLPIMEERDDLRAKLELAQNQLRIEYTRNDALARIRDATARIAQVFGDDVGFVMPIDGEIGSVQFVLNRYKEIKDRAAKCEADGAEYRELALKWERKCAALMEAGRKLVVKLDEVFASKSLKEVFFKAAMNGTMYTGKSLSAEIDELRMLCCDVPTLTASEHEARRGLLM